MEAIKFSELPSGDRMPLADEDGVPIIANQENRLLTWGRLKQQIAAQTHTDTVDESEKIPTAKAVSDALGSLNSDLHDEFDEKIDDAQAKAEGANATAKSALASAGSASRDAQSAENKAAEAVSKVAEATSAAKTAEGKAEEAKAAIVLPEQKVTQYHIVDYPEDTQPVDLFKFSTEPISDVTLAQVCEQYNDNFEILQVVFHELLKVTHQNYSGKTVVITAGSADSENGLMTGAPSIAETADDVTDVIAINDAVAQIFANQKALYDILMDTRKRAIANASNLTAMLTNINSILTQIMN